MLKKSLIIIFLILISFSLFSASNQELVDTITLLIESNEQLIVRVEFLEAENKVLIEENNLLINNLRSSNNTIIQLKDLISKSSNEIEILRDTIKSVSAQVDKDKSFSIGIGASYPLGGSVLITARPKNFPVGGFLDLNINKETGAFVSLGIIYSF